jgi:hypothetical protein
MRKAKVIFQISNHHFIQYEGRFKNTIYYHERVVYTYSIIPDEDSNSLGLRGGLKKVKEEPSREPSKHF